jgi:hypothetical protein
VRPCLKRERDTHTQTEREIERERETESKVEWEELGKQCCRVGEISRTHCSYSDSKEAENWIREKLQNL